MGQVEVRDFQIWANHIHGDENLKSRVLAMKAGELIELEVDGFRGVWKKMENNKDSGEPTEGIKPFGKARGRWHQLCGERREDLVSITEA